MTTKDLKSLDENKELWLTELSKPKNDNTSSLLHPTPTIKVENPSKNTLKFIPNPDFAEELVNEVENGK